MARLYCIKLFFYFARGYQLQIPSWLVLCTLFFLSMLRHHLTRTCEGHVCASIAPMCASALLCLEDSFFGIIHCLWFLKKFFQPSLLNITKPWGEGIKGKDIHLGQSAPKSFIPCTLFCVLFPISCKWKLCRWQSKALIYRYSSMSLSLKFPCHFCRKITFGFPPNPCPM